MNDEAEPVAVATATATAQSWRAARYWDAHWQRMDRARLDALHLRRIRQIMEYAYARVPFYRRLYDRAGVKPEDVKTWDDFYHRVPFTDKPDVMADQPAEGLQFGFESISRAMRSLCYRTSGTTGVPLNEVFSSYDSLAIAQQVWAYGWWDAGMRPGDSIYFAFNFGTYVGFWTALFAAERMGLMIIPAGGLDTKARVRQILELRPDAVIATPTYLLHMAEVARAERLDLAAAGVRFLTMAGEVGPSVPAVREALRAGWGRPRICDMYGISEPLFAACECAAVDQGKANGTHVLERYAHSYVVDPGSLAPVADEAQVGEHIVTSFRLAQPLIKYRTHDLVRLQRNPDHGCGWTLAFFDGGVLGRTDQMVTIRGVNVYTTAVQSILGGQAGASPYYELHITRDSGLDAISIRVEAQPDVPHTEHGPLRQRLAHELRYRVGVSFGVEVLPPGALPRYELKSRRVFDHRGEAEG